MNERYCHRCESVLHIESEGALLYCFHCGAPQLILSEELQAQTDERLKREKQDAEHSPRAERSPNAVNWKQMIRLCMLVSSVLAALSVVLPPLALLVFAWAPVVPAIVFWLYSARARSKQTLFTAGLGVRVGAICGSFIVLALALVNTLALDVTRYALHRNDFDTSVNTMLAQIQAQATAQSGAEAATDVFKWFAIPEFRAGFFLGGFAIMTVCVLLLSMGGGAFSGFFRQRRRVS